MQFGAVGGWEWGFGGEKKGFTLRLTRQGALCAMSQMGFTRLTGLESASLGAPMQGACKKHLFWGPRKPPELEHALMQLATWIGKWKCSYRMTGQIDIPCHQARLDAREKGKSALPQLVCVPTNIREPGALRGGVHLSAHLIPAQRTCDRPAQAAVPRLPELVLPAAPGQGHHPGPWAHSSTGRRATHAQSRTGARKGMLLGILWLGG
eukprot:1137194-Pelagomonas_calceolata.AAC.2